MEPKKLSILGSTGSIGVQALDVAGRLGWPVIAMAAGGRVEPFEEQVRRFRPQVVAMADERAAADLKVRLSDLPVKVLSGMQGVCEVAAVAGADMVLNSVVGVAGLRPTLAAIAAGHDVALANKETLVAGGAAVTAAVRERGVRLLPVDSEHSAIFQCIQGAPPDRKLRRIILTASGGPFFGRSAAELEQMTPAQALKHPNWDMGAKVTIDSATLMNKGLELIEARWLFDLPPEQIDIVVHRESIIHSLVEYADGSVIAQLGLPDMRLPIQYAFTWPERTVCPIQTLDLAACGKLTFYAPDDEAFPAMSVCREAIRRGGLYPAAVNAVNERAVAAFLAGKIGFGEISRLAARVLDEQLPAADSVEEVLAADREFRLRADDWMR